MSYIIGLTGGIGSGKTAVSDTFASLGITIVDADVVAREVVLPGTQALKAIQTHFGDGILLDDGTLNRAQLRSIIFSSPDEKAWLESLLHPRIRTSIQERLHQASSPYVILVSPLLLETNQKELVDRILLVDVSPEIQLQRTMTRDDNSREQVKAIMATQSSREFKQSHADDIILNDRDLEYLQTQCKSLHEQYLHLCDSTEKTKQ